MLPRLASKATHREARVELERQGWETLAQGDWAFVHASPCGRLVARVCAFDPAYALHARNCVAHPECVYFQDVKLQQGLRPVGEIVVMERLEDAPEAVASQLCCALGEVKHLERDVTAAEVEEWAEQRRRDPALQATFEILHATATEAQEGLGYFGGLDVRPGNVMQNDEGQLKLIDPYFVAGKELIEALLRDAEEVARRYSPMQLRAFLEIACFDSEGDAPGPVLVQLRERVEALEARGNRSG